MRRLLAILAIPFLLAPLSGAADVDPSIGPVPVSALGPASQQAADPRLPHLIGTEDPSTRALWLRGLELEDRGSRAEAIDVYQLIAPRIPSSAQAQWRIARMHWLIGDLMPNNESQDSPSYDQYVLAEKWARRGLEIDSKCAECMLWLYAALGRITVCEGLLSGVKYVRTMSNLLDDGIALRPNYRDSDFNSTLGNLYYARAIFNRMVPDWWWLKILVGARGDKEQALEDIDDALALNGNRIDYQVEKGAVLMCLGTSKKRDYRIEQGRQVLREAMTFERRLETDKIDLMLARQMIENPANACGFTRGGFVDIEGEAKKL